MDMTEPDKAFVIYKDVSGEWRWTLYARNSKKIADGAESYRNKADCIHGARLVAAIAAGTNIWNSTDNKWE